MKCRPTLLLLAILTAPALFAQVEPAPVQPASIPERVEVQDPDGPFTLVEEMPSYPGGQDALFAYISTNLKYPQEAMDKGIQGTVIVAFVVERNGSISEVRTLRGIGGGCDEEAVRVVQGMPDWTPGKQGGKAVRVRFNLPIRYRLQEEKRKK